MPRKIDAYFLEIFTAISDIRKFVGSISEESYKNDEKTKSAVERKLLVIGEALTQI